MLRYQRPNSGISNVRNVISEAYHRKSTLWELYKLPRANVETLNTGKTIKRGTYFLKSVCIFLHIVPSTISKPWWGLLLFSLVQEQITFQGIFVSTDRVIHFCENQYKWMVGAKNQCTAQAFTPTIAFGFCTSSTGFLHQSLYWVFVPTIALGFCTNNCTRFLHQQYWFFAPTIVLGFCTNNCAEFLHQQLHWFFAPTIVLFFCTNNCTGFLHQLHWFFAPTALVFCTHCAQFLHQPLHWVFAPTIRDVSFHNLHSRTKHPATGPTTGTLMIHRQDRSRMYIIRIVAILL